MISCSRLPSGRHGRHAPAPPAAADSFRSNAARSSWRRASDARRPAMCPPIAAQQLMLHCNMADPRGDSSPYYSEQIRLLTDRAETERSSTYTEKIVRIALPETGLNSRVDHAEGHSCQRRSESGLDPPV